MIFALVMPKAKGSLQSATTAGGGSCSVFVETTPTEKLADIAKLPNLAEMKFIAHYSITSSSGRIKPHERDDQHISFWMIDSLSARSLHYRG